MLSIGEYGRGGSSVGCWFGCNDRLERFDCMRLNRLVSPSCSADSRCLLMVSFWMPSPLLIQLVAWVVASITDVVSTNEEDTDR